MYFVRLSIVRQKDVKGFRSILHNCSANACDMLMLKTRMKINWFTGKLQIKIFIQTIIFPSSSSTLNIPFILTNLRDPRRLLRTFLPLPLIEIVKTHRHSPAPEAILAHKHSPAPPLAFVPPFRGSLGEMNKIDYSCPQDQGPTARSPGYQPSLKVVWGL